ncbi:MAG: TetR family transcriptional regulator [Deltaproteobacteria bacterium]|nr:TetR family transcriptional regulator [Deltaproteobacteria bacterium]MBW2444888.1 TetR family transcriptional regulator [Deltaproteobacteria bacterium]
MTEAERVTASPAAAPIATDGAPRRRNPEDTKERLLDAAERLFADRGFEGASLRAVTQAAGTSVSAAHYHFGSKEALLVATIRRRTEPVIKARAAQLDALERRAGGAALPLEEVLEAFLRPIFAERARPDRGDDFRRIAARLFSDPPPIIAALKREVFGRTAARFLDALARALPDKPRQEIALDLQFLVGVMVHVTAGHLEDFPTPDGWPSLSGLPDEVVLDRMIQFVAAGLRAPARSHS